jgi:hypothetical protein
VYLPVSPFVRMVLDAIIVSYALWMISGSVLTLFNYFVSEIERGP